MVKNNLFSPTIFKQTFIANSKLWLIFTLILCVLGAVIISVFDQKTITSMMALIEDTPMANMIKMTSLLGMLAQTYYALHIIILTLIYIIMTANSLIASQVDRGSMAYILSTPIKRSVVVRTQAVYLIGSLFLMFLTITLTGLLSVQLFHGGIIGEQYTEDVKAANSELASDELVKDEGIDFVTLDYVMMNLGVFLLMFAISSISFLFSCLFNLSKNSLALGAGIPIAFYIFKLMGDVDVSLEFFKYLSLNTLFDTDAIINGGDYTLQFVALGVVGVVLYVLSVRIFVKKDLPL